MSANEHQVGGSHYGVAGKDLQHWDLVRIFGWDYFQGQITKYVMRWKDKGATFEDRLKDLKKARHFLDKYIEDAEKWDTHNPRSTEALDPPVQTQPPSTESPNWQVEGFYGDGRNHYKCLRCGTSINAFDIDQAEQIHGECPGPAYLRQAAGG